MLKSPTLPYPSELSFPPAWSLKVLRYRSSFRYRTIFLTEEGSANPIIQTPKMMMCLDYPVPRSCHNLLDFSFLLPSGPFFFFFSFSNHLLINSFQQICMNTPQNNWYSRTWHQKILELFWRGWRLSIFFWSHLGMFTDFFQTLSAYPGMVLVLHIVGVQ